jgi:hypothetical protein
MCNKCRPPVTAAYFIDDKGNKRDISELSQVIDEVVFPKPTPEQAKAFEEFYEAMKDHPPTHVYALDIPDE